MTWGMVGAAAITAVGSYESSKNASKGGGGGQQYVPGGLSAADNTFQDAMHGSYDLAAGARGFGSDAFQQSYGQQMGINYDPYMQRAGQAGQAYGQMGDIAMGQVPGYEAAAERSAQQQIGAFGMANQVAQTAFDPQNALYDRTAQRTQDQIRAGQAARGLGNSETGMMEEAGAMSNFNIDWQNAQLARQATGIQAAGAANNSGVGLGQLTGADLSAGLAAGAAGAGYYGQAGQVPMTAQEYAAGGPGRAAGGLVAGYGSLQQMYGNAQAGTIPYMNSGNGAIQTNYQNGYQQNRDMAGALGQVGQAAGPAVAGWFGNGGAGAAQGAFSQTAMGGSGFGTGMAYGNQDMGQFL